ncbi:hypothetical protein INS90_08580 [Trueperella pecoris]|uniref:Pyrroloquinoline-quinone binding quinoprotein n=1 Tax=Trueperella pecoris TaxID=2733571 RepID=A0A7M1QZ58_9ACTO|nr:hypothetical protein [Trueperella pecoris]QOR47309.1 hypothetical protein INS90_08580 [Trueperella pecoris]
MSRRTAWALIVLAAAIVGVSACAATPSEEADVNREVRTKVSAPATVDVSEMNVPVSLQGLKVYDPEWVVMPQYAQEVYIAPRDVGHALEYVAMSTSGEALWAVERPRSCTGFVVTETNDGRPLAVLLDSHTSADKLAGITATAHDLRTGEVVWGPVEVPGTYSGPGLVFASTPRGVISEGGQRVALDRDTGSIVSGQSAEERVLGDVHGTLITLNGSVLLARDSHAAVEKWRLDVVEQGWDPQQIRAAVDENAATHYARLTLNQGPGPVIDIRDGTILHAAARDMGEDPLTGSVVVLTEDGLTSYDAEHRQLWSTSALPDTTIQTVGGVFVYVREGETIRVHNVLTGAIAQAYLYDHPGTILVPAHLGPTGAALVFDKNGYVLLVTVPPLGER